MSSSPLTSPAAPTEARPGPAPRWAVWALCATSVLALAAHVLGYLSEPADRLWPANAAWTFAAIAAVTGAAIATRAADRAQRRAWSLLLCACVVWLAGQLLYNLYGATSFPSSPHLADLSWLAFAVLAAVAVHRLVLGAVGQRTLWWYETTPVVAAVVALMTALMWRDIVDSDLPGAAQVTALAYPVFYSSTAMVMLQSVLAGALDLRRNAGLAVVLLGLVLQAAAFSLWCPQLLTSSYVVGAGPIDVLWTLGLICIGIGAWKAGPARPVADFEHVISRRGGVLPSLTFVTLAVMQIALAARDASQGAELPLSIGMLIVGGGLIARASMLRRRQAELLERLRAREGELADVNQRLSAESRQDPLTGLANRLRLSEDFADLAARFARYGEPYCLVIIDVDHFKMYNDLAGHQAGDRVLREVARLLQAGTREGDRAYRYGGEEIVLILQGQDAAGGQAIAERHFSALRRLALAHPGNYPSGLVTLSGGVAAARAGETPEHVLRRADRALYEAKAEGRDRTMVADDASERGPGALIR